MNMFNIVEVNCMFYILIVIRHTVGFNVLRTYAVRFVVAQFIARPAGRSLPCRLPDMLFCVETGTKEGTLSPSLFAQLIPTTNL